MVIAAVLTVVILLGYGGYTAWNAVTGGSDAPAESTTSTEFAPTVQRAMSYGDHAVTLGLEVRAMKEIGAFKYDIDRAIEGVRAERANLETLAATAGGPQADILRSSIQATDALESAMFQWRDAIATLRLGNVETAQSAIDSAVAQLGSDLTRWGSLER